MICNKCGSENSEDAKFCTKCGAPLNGGNQQAEVQQNYQSQRSYSAPVGDNFDYTPISMWGYFGYEILFSIPCVGIVLLLVFSFGGTKNINLRNFARSYFCFVIVIAVLTLFLTTVVGISLGEVMR